MYTIVYIGERDALANISVNMNNSALSISCSCHAIHVVIPVCPHDTVWDLTSRENYLSVYSIISRNRNDDEP